MTDSGGVRMVEVFCACTLGQSPCPRATVLPAADGRPVSLAPAEGWHATPDGWVCPRCAHPDHRYIPPEPT